MLSGRVKRVFCLVTPLPPRLLQDLNTPLPPKLLQDLNTPYPPPGCCKI